MRCGLIEYSSIKIVIQLDQDYTFSPYVPDPRFIDYLPRYFEGLINYQGDSSLLFSLSSLLNLKDDNDEILLHTSSNTGRFSMRIPIPEIIEIPASELTQSKETDSSITVPSGKYVIINSITCMFLSLTNLSKFISNEIDSSLSIKWKEQIPDWENFDHVKPEIQQTYAASKQSEILPISDKTENTIICSISDFNICFNEKYSVELLASTSEIIRLPDAPIWVVGLFDYYGESITLLDLRSYFNIGNPNSTYIIAVVKTDAQEKFAFMIDSMSSQSNIGIKASMFDEVKPNDQLIFTNIAIMTNGKILFYIDFNQLILAVNNKLPSLDWNIWKEQFTFKQTEIDNLRGIEEEEQDTIKFASIKYPGINILLDMDDSYTLHPNLDIKKQDFLPKYCNGMGIIQNKPVLVINLAELLKIPDSTGDSVYLFGSNQENEYYVFEIPVPNIFDYNASEFISDTDVNGQMKVISSKYLIVDDGVYLRITSKDLFGYLEHELSTILSRSWKSNNLTWSTFNPIKEHQLVIPIIDRRSDEKIISFDTDTYISFTLGESNLCVEESQFIELLTLDNIICRFPNSTTYLSGVFSYQGDSIPLLDINKILNLSDGADNLIVLILKSNNGIFGFLINNASFRRIAKIDYESIINPPSEFIFNDILFDGKEIIFKMDLNEMIKWIGSKQEYKIDIWKKFIQFSSEQYISLVDKIKEAEIEKDYIGIVVLEYTFLIKVDNILRIRNKDAREEIKTESLTFVNFNDQWIPSVELYAELENPISLIIKSGNLIIELLTNYLYFENIEGLALENETLEKLYANHNYYGVENVLFIKKGIAFELNVNNLITNLLKLDIKSISKIRDEIDRPVPQEEEEEQESLMQIWQEGIELIVIIEDIKKNKKAIRGNQIQEFLLETDNEFIPWNETEENQYIYISTKGIDSKIIYYQIPTTCYIRPIPQIEETDEIILEDEPIKIINLNK